MKTNETISTPVQNFNIRTNLGVVFTQTIKNDVSRIVHLMNLASIYVEDVSSSAEFPELDDHVTLKFDVSGKQGREYDFDLEAIVFIQDRAKANEIAQRISEAADVSVTASIEGDFMRTWVSGHQVFSMNLKP